tara:strand:+ start:454 stop:621 length:168 start_codon:yes stop_codon:yes gene_type:complete
MPRRTQKEGPRYRYRMKYKARMKALSPDQMRAKALAENRDAAALEEAQALYSEEE